MADRHAPCRGLLQTGVVHAGSFHIKGELPLLMLLGPMED